MEYISTMGVRYGLLSNIRAHSPESLKKENSMKYTSEIPKDDTAYILTENFQTRSKNNKISRLEKGNSHDKNRLNNHPSLLSRINGSEEINPEGKLDSHKGVEYRQIDTFKDDDFVEYQLFDDNETYFQNKNIPENGDIGIRANLPSFTKNIRK
jgi:hypothetical protein